MAIALSADSGDGEGSAETNKLLTRGERDFRYGLRCAMDGGDVAGHSADNNNAITPTFTARRIVKGFRERLRHSTSIDESDNSGGSRGSTKVDRGLDRVTGSRTAARCINGNEDVRDVDRRPEAPLETVRRVDVDVPCH